MSSTPRLIGTLIVVVLKAKNLPNKRTIGKQDPYCTLKLHSDTKRSKAVKRGGQHPEWDEEIRFELFEDIEDELARINQGRRSEGSSPPAPPPKDKDRKIKGGKAMRLLCYADDPREPELIGETIVDLSEVLKKGETDEWYTLMNKDKYSGEVYLEMTFWSNDKPPEKKPTDRPSSLHPHYGGPGSFTPAEGHGRGGSSGSSPAGSKRTSFHERQGSMPTDGAHSSIPSTSSLAHLNLYIPPYTQDSGSHHRQRKYDPASEFGDAALRRQSYPPPGQQQQAGYGYNPAAYGTPANPNPYDTISQLALGDPYASSSPSAAYYQSTQSTQFTNNLYQQNSTPVASGFAPPQPSLTPHPSSFAPPQPGITPQPSGFQPIYSGFSAPRPTGTPMPGFAPPASSMGFHGYQTPLPTGYAQTGPQPPMPAFQHHPNSYPSSLQPGHTGALPFTPPVPPATAQPTQAPSTMQQHPPPQASGMYQQQQPIQPNPTGQGRPLPDQPQQAPLSFPNALPYNHGGQGTLPASGSHGSIQGMNNTAQAPMNTGGGTGFVPPPPPPLINNQPHRATSLPAVPAPPSNSMGSAAPTNNGLYAGNNNGVYNNHNLPTPPQQQQTISQNNTGNSGSGRAGLPLPPVPNPHGQIQMQPQSAFYTGPSPVSSAPLPGPPPTLAKPGFNAQMQGQQQQQQQGQGQGHMQQPSYGSNSTGYNAQPMYNGQQQQQQGIQYQGGGPWQQQQQPQGFHAGYGQQYAPSHTPVPQAGAYPYPPQVQTPWQ